MKSTSKRTLEKFVKRFFLFLVFLTCSVATEAWACSCAGPGTPKEAFDKVNNHACLIRWKFTTYRKPKSRIH